jgi:hypothetical protein
MELSWFCRIKFPQMTSLSRETEILGELDAWEFFATLEPPEWAFQPEFLGYVSTIM